MTLYIYLLPLYIYCDKRYKRGFLQRHPVARDWLNGCSLYVALIYNTSQSLFLIASFLFLFCISYKFIRIKNKKMKKLRAIFIHKKYFSNNLVVDSLVATFLANFFKGSFFLETHRWDYVLASSKIAVAKWCLNRAD